MCPIVDEQTSRQLSIISELKQATRGFNVNIGTPLFIVLNIMYMGKN
ncbi:hypothetical protein PROVRETT_09936 [Providencia rettgeri DSM 1131]|nr:hypothetical protein PROVRETT_09936 [Providencia rettgeri DSM 1131]